MTATAAIKDAVGRGKDSGSPARGASPSRAVARAARGGGGGGAEKPKGAPPAIVDKAGIRHPPDFFINRRRPNRTGIMPLGTTDIAAADERPREGISKLSPAGGAKKGWGKRSDRHGSRNKHK